MIYDLETYIICGVSKLVQDEDLDTFYYKHINDSKSRETVLEMSEEVNLYGS